METVYRIQSLEKYGIKPGLERISALLGYLNHPEKAYDIIIVGGTNGKGSTCVMIDSILRSAGYKIGLYTSPHLVSINERIRVNNSMIRDTALNAISEQLFGIIDNHSGLYGTTYFEFLTALAMEYFKERHIEIAVVEVGMGGRFDATNATHPVISTITNVSADHQIYLGSTTEDIAREKAGIIRAGSPLITTDINPASRHIFEDECAKKNGRFYAVNRDFSFDGDESNMNFYGTYRTIGHIKLSLKGRHQLYNASAAIQSVELLEQTGRKISEDAVKHGLSNTSWPGRFEIIRERPYVIFDSAHNPAGMRALVQTLKDYYKGKPVTIVFAVSKDKNRHTMLLTLSQIANIFVLTSFKGERSAEPLELKSHLDNNIRTDIIASSCDALKHAVNITPAEGVILVTGSIYLIGELKKETDL